jgi:hypothetical protein
VCCTSSRSTARVSAESGTVESSRSARAPRVIDSTPTPSFSISPASTGRITNTPIEPVSVWGWLTIVSAALAT